MKQTRSREQGKRDAAKLLAKDDGTPERRQQTLAAVKRIQATYPAGCPEWEYWGGYFTVVNTSK
jgi:hypothetical protein